MPRNTRCYEVLIASPSDVRTERQIIVECIEDWNAAHSRSSNVILQPRRWELDAYPELGDRPQEIINTQIVDTSDIVLGVFWHRIGTPTGLAPPNGTAVVKFLPEPHMAGAPTAAQAIGPTDVMTTDLGRQKQDKLLLIGKRVTGTIAVGKIGNEEPIEVVHDSWVSPDLKLVVKELNQDPRTGNRAMEITHIRQEEPDAALFLVPAEYTVKERPDVLSHPLVGVSLGTRLGDAGVPGVEVARIAEARKATDPAIKSDVAYKLAMEKIDLPDAQSLAEEAVKLQEERTVAFDVKKADVDAFAQMTLLSRYWNTLGWVLPTGQAGSGGDLHEGCLGSGSAGLLWGAYGKNL